MELLEDQRQVTVGDPHPVVDDLDERWPVLAAATATTCSCWARREPVGTGAQAATTLTAAPTTRTFRIMLFLTDMRRSSRRCDRRPCWARIAAAVPNLNEPSSDCQVIVRSLDWPPGPTRPG